MITRPSMSCQDSQSKFELARAYKKHLDEVGADRQLEEFLQARHAGGVSLYNKVVFLQSGTESIGE